MGLVRLTYAGACPALPLKSQPVRLVVAERLSEPTTCACHRANVPERCTLAECDTSPPGTLDALLIPLTRSTTVCLSYRCRAGREADVMGEGPGLLYPPTAVRGLSCFWGTAASGQRDGPAPSHKAAGNTAANLRTSGGAAGGHHGGQRRVGCPQACVLASRRQPQRGAGRPRHIGSAACLPAHSSAVPDRVSFMDGQRLYYRPKPAGSP